MGVGNSASRHSETLEWLRQLILDTHEGPRWSFELSVAGVGFLTITSARLPLGRNLVTMNVPRDSKQVARGESRPAI